MRQILLLLSALLLTCCSDDSDLTAQTITQKMYITIGGRTVEVILADNAATQELVRRLQTGDVNVTLDTNESFEIWGPLGFSLPTSNERMTAQQGDVILYNGSNICIFCGSNTWNYTRLGKIEGLTESELQDFLKIGQSNIDVSLSLQTEAAGVNSVRRNVSEDGAYYSLSGRRIANPKKGIYIKNGKKVKL